MYYLECGRWEVTLGNLHNDLEGKEDRIMATLEMKLNEAYIISFGAPL